MKRKFSAWAGIDADDGHVFTAPVGSFRPNVFGLHDLHGNVREWCQDWKGGYPNKAVTDPHYSAEGSERVVRGGSWDISASRCRSAIRCGLAPSERGGVVGFRLVRVSSGP